MPGMIDGDRISQMLQGLQKSWSPSKYRDPEIEDQIPDLEGGAMRGAQGQIADSGANYVPSRVDMADQMRSGIQANRAASMMAGLDKARLKLSPEQQEIDKNDETFQLQKEGERERIRSAGDLAVERERGGTQRSIADTQGRTQRDVASIQYPPDRFGPNSSSSRPLPRVANTKALNTAVERARGNSGTSGGIFGALSGVFGLNKGKQGAMEVPDDQMEQVLSSYQGVLSDNRIPNDVQEAAMGLVQKFPGMAPEEKIKHLGEIGYDSSQLNPADTQLLIRALRMTGGF